MDVGKGKGRKTERRQKGDTASNDKEGTQKFWLQLLQEAHGTNCRKKKADEAQKQKNVGAVDQSSVQSTSSTASVGAVALVSSTSQGSGLGRLIMAISDQGES